MPLGRCRNSLTVLVICAQEFRGFAFVSFRSTFAAEDATEDANGKEALGGRLKVNVAKYKSIAPNARRDERCAKQHCCT